MERDGGSADDRQSPRELLAAEMRRLKAASRLSYGRLAERTHYSRSSWERFLNGKQLPTRVAVEQFATASGEEDPGALLALLEAAEREQRPGAEPVGPVEPVGPMEPVELVEPVEAAVAAATPAPAPAPAETRRARLARRARRAQPDTVTAPATAPAWRRALRAAGFVTAGALVGSVMTVVAIDMDGAKSGSGSGITTGSGSGITTGSGSGTEGPAKATGSASVGPAAGGVKPGCSADSCVGREPQAMDCHWDATSVRHTWLRGLHIQLRYSAVCQAVWGRIENGTVGDSVTIKDKRGLEQEATIRVGTDTYTRMLAVAGDTPDSVTICGAIPEQRERECSPVGGVQP